MLGLPRYNNIFGYFTAISLYREFRYTVMIRFSALLPISAPLRISAPPPPFECVFVNKRPYSNKRPSLISFPIHLAPLF